MGSGNGYDERFPADYVLADRGSAIGGGAQINNTLSVLALFIAALVSSAAIMLAVSAKDASVIAEREARLAQRRYDDMRIYLEVHGIELETETENVER